MTRSILVAIWEQKAGTDVVEMEKILEILKNNGYEVGDDNLNPLIVYIFKKHKEE